MPESNDDFPEQVEKLRTLIEAGNAKALVREVRTMRPADLAQALDGFHAHEKALLFEALSIEAAAELLDEADEQSQQEIMSESESERLVEVLDELPPDEAADVLGVVDEEDASKLLDRMEPDLAEQVEQLMEYPEDSAGGVMTTDVVKLDGDTTVAQAVQETQKVGDSEGVRYPYVVDANGVLVGVVPLYTLVFGKPDTKVRDIMEKDVISVTADTDREDVGNIVRRYGLSSLPVVDKDKRLIGIVTVDDVIEAIEDEVSEDMYRIAGTGERDPLRGPLLSKIWLRLPWLIITLFGGLLICTVVSKFQGSLLNAIALASFLPIIPLMGGNVAIQASTIVVRGLALGNIERGRILRLLLREFAVAIVLGILCGLVAGLMAHILHGQIALSGVIAMAVFVAVVVAVIMGTLIPLVFHSLGLDPALAAGPFVTILNDLTSVTIYLTLASALIHNMKQ